MRRQSRHTPLGAQIGRAKKLAREWAAGVPAIAIRYQEGGGATVRIGLHVPHVGPLDVPLRRLLPAIAVFVRAVALRRGRDFRGGTLSLPALFSAVLLGAANAVRPPWERTG